MAVAYFVGLELSLTIARLGRSISAGDFILGDAMTFRLIHAHFERNSKRAYVELREDDEDGGEMIVAAIFSFRRTTILTKRALEQEIATKARHLMRRASVGLDIETTRSKKKVRPGHATTAID